MDDKLYVVNFDNGDGTAYRAAFAYLDPEVCRANNISTGGFYFAFGVGNRPMTGYFWHFNNETSLDYVIDKLDLGAGGPGLTSGITAWLCQQALSGKWARNLDRDKGLWFYLRYYERDWPGLEDYTLQVLDRADEWLDTFELAGGSRWREVRPDLLGNVSDLNANWYITHVLEQQHKEADKRARVTFPELLDREQKIEESKATYTGPGTPVEDMYEQSQADQDYIRQLRDNGDPVEMDQVREPIYPITTECPHCGARWSGPHAPGCPGTYE